MSWYEALHLALSIAVCIAVFIMGDDEPFLARIAGAVIAALFWLPLLVIFAIWMIGDGIDALIKRVRK